MASRTRSLLRTNQGYKRSMPSRVSRRSRDLRPFFARRTSTLQRPPLPSHHPWTTWKYSSHGSGYLLFSTLSSRVLWTGCKMLPSIPTSTSTLHCESQQRPILVSPNSRRGWRPPLTISSVHSPFAQATVFFYASFPTPPAPVESPS